MKRVVVTGAAGFIGKQLLLQMAEQNVKVTAVVRPGSAHNVEIPPSRWIDKIEMPMTDIEKLSERLPPQDVFIHLAWVGARGQARMDRELQQKNAEAGLLAVKTALALHCDAFVGCGSQAEYGRQGEQTVESSPTVPDTEYGKEKLAVCEQGKQLAANTRMRFVWPRIFSIYGPGDFEGTLMSTAMQKMLCGESIALSPCTQQWDFLYVSDAAAALLLLAENKKADGIYNVAYGESHPLRWYLETMKCMLHSRSQLDFGAVPSDSGGLAGFSPDVEKLKKLGWKPIFPFPDGVKEYEKWVNARHL